MLTSRLTSTLRRASRRDPVDRLTVTMAGRSCGVSPMAIASENSNASMNGRCSTRLMTKIEAVSTPATRTSRNENRRNPTWNAVSAGRSPRPAAMRPKPVCMPVRTTTPRAEPSRTIVPINAHERSPFGTASAVFSTGIDSPVSTASSHSSSTVSSRRTSAGTMSPTESCTRSPGTSAVTSTRFGTVANDERGVVDLRMQRLDRLLGAELVHEAETDREGHDHADDHGARRIAGEPRDGGGREQQQEQRIAELTREHRPRARRDCAARSGRRHAAARWPRRSTSRPDPTPAPRARRRSVSAPRCRGLVAPTRNATGRWCSRSAV